MSTDVHKKYSQSPAKRAAFLERVEHYVNKRPEWTPAEGALLVNGVIPPPKGCKDIPEADDDLRQLDDSELPATQSQLLGAKRVFQDYLAHVENGGLPPGKNVMSDDFLKWCHESDQAPWNVTRLPEFLRHLYFAGSSNHPFMLSVADELTSLKLMVKEAASRIRQTGKSGKKPGLYTEILFAQNEAERNSLPRNDPDVIWGILVKMSENKSFRLLGNDRNGIVYSSPNGPKPYTYTALKKYLSPK